MHTGFQHRPANVLDRDAALSQIRMKYVSESNYNASIIGNPALFGFLSVEAEQTCSSVLAKPFLDRKQPQAGRCFEGQSASTPFIHLHLELHMTQTKMPVQTSNF